VASHSQSRHEVYENPLIGRYASEAMGRLWSRQRIHSTWRRLWVALAEVERELGLPITQAQIDELAAAVDDIDFDLAARYERELRHDVMAHVYTYRDRCPGAGGILHLGATSAFVTDNTELILIRESLQLVRTGLVAAIDALALFAERHRALPCLGLTHLQPAQPTTVGKRATLWCYDLVLDLEEVEHRLARLKFRGAKGTTGTQASFLALFDGDHAKVDVLDRRVAEKMGFAASYPVTGQTYSRKIDAQALAALSGIGQSAHKAGTDLRILQSRKEIDEPFESKQIGSSAMAYKRNPMRSERMCALSRFAISLAANAENTAATQWMERTLDDSANRRLSLPQSFLAIDAVLALYGNIVRGLVVHARVIERNLVEELPFLMTEQILMAGVRAGGDRQELHERIRVHSIEAARLVKEEGARNDLLDRLAGDQAFISLGPNLVEEIGQVVQAKTVLGRAPEQVDAFVRDVVGPIRSRYAADLGKAADTIRV
jgi:adenylosuccinate lyase